MEQIKQEAQRIFNRFYNETLSHLSDHITREDAIQSALICVEEMKSSQPWDLYTILQSERVNKYYFNLKEEIKKLRR